MKPPAPFDVLWGRRQGGTRPREAGLSVERVVAAAVEIADEHGLDAVSMGRVAKRLGFTTMALYRHVRNKDELLALMVDAAVGWPSDAGEEGEGWRAGLERWAWGLLEVVRLHPWLLNAPLAELPFGPNRLAWFDRGLAALAGTNIAEAEKGALVLLLNGHVFSEVRFTAGAAVPRAEASPETATGSDLEPLAELVDEERFPALRRALGKGVFDTLGDDRDADFRFGLERILDGIESLVEARAKS